MTRSFGMAAPRSGAFATAFLAWIMLFGACGGTDEVTNQVAVTDQVAATGQVAPQPWWQAERKVALRVDGGGIVEGFGQPFEYLVSRAQSIVAGRVVSVDGPFWNQANGQYWAEDLEGDWTVPVLYREVTVEMSRTLYLAEGLELSQDGILVSFLVNGDGAGESPNLSALDGGGPHFTVGDEVVVLLEYIFHPFRESAVDVWTATYGASSSLTLSAGGDYSLQVGAGAPQQAFLEVDISGILEKGGLSLADIESLVGIIKAQPPLPGRGRPEDMTGDRIRAEHNLPSVPACLNTPRGEC